jgi:hypothetical protein
MNKHDIKNIEDIICTDLDGPISPDLYKHMIKLLLHSYDNIKNEKNGMKHKIIELEKKVITAETNQKLNNSKYKQKLIQIEQLLNKKLSFKELVIGKYDINKFSKFIKSDDL